MKIGWSAQFAHVGQFCARSNTIRQIPTDAKFRHQKSEPSTRATAPPATQRAFNMHGPISTNVTRSYDVRSAPFSRRDAIARNQRPPQAEAVCIVKEQRRRHGAATLSPCRPAITRATSSVNGSGCVRERYRDAGRWAICFGKKQVSHDALFAGTPAQPLEQASVGSIPHDISKRLKQVQVGSGLSRPVHQFDDRGKGIVHP